MATPKATKPSSSTQTSSSLPLGINSKSRVKPRFESKARIPVQLLNPELEIIEASMEELGLFLQTAIEAIVYDGNSVANCLTLKQAFESYAVQIDRIARVKSDWKSLVARMIAVESQKLGIDELNLLDTDLQNEVALWHQEILTADGMALPVAASIVSAKLASLELDQIKVALSSNISEAISASSVAIRCQLIRLVELEAISFVEWFGANSCSYERFCRRVTSEIRKRELVRAGIFKVEGGRWKKGTIHSLQGSTKRTLACSIQHLTNANSYRLGESKVLIPREQSTFIDSIPNWLRPGIRIVEGTLIRETHVEQDLTVREWEMTLDQTQWHHDPAVVLGPFVLSAWGPTEIKAELAKQQAEARVLADVGRKEKRQLSPIRIFGITQAVLASFFCMGWHSSYLNLVIGLVTAFLAFVVLGNRWKADKATPQPKKADANPVPKVAFGYAGLFISFVLLSSLLLSVGLIVGGVGCGLISLLSLQLYLKATDSWNPVTESGVNGD